MRLMVQIWRLKRFKPFIGYLILTVAILSSSLLFGQYTRSKRLEAPTHSVEALKASLSETLLASSSISNADGRQDTVYNTLYRSEVKLNESLNSSLRLLDERRSDISPEQYNSLKTSLEQQQSLLISYQNRFKQVGKAIQYNPSLDFQNLDLSKTEDSALLTTRAEDAFENLRKVGSSSQSNLTADAFVLSETTKNALDKEAECLESLSKSADNNETKTLILKQCIRLYPIFRQPLVNDLTALFRNKQSQNSQNNISRILEEF